MLRGVLDRLASALSLTIGHPLLALVARIGIAAIFWFSGRTKVDGFRVTDGAAACVATSTSSR